MSGKRKLTHPHAAHSACDATHGRVMNLLSPEFEYMDPNPDIHALFIEYDRLFFDGKLVGCEVKWSKRMTLCAGVCSFQPSSGFCSIRLSEPLLKLRPRSDLINTLLHEMIHAFVFVSSPVRDRDDHGPIFQSHMDRINQRAGTVITVFHTFHDEVDTYRQHWWQCDGACRRKPPYFGLVKRAMNRPPGPLDRWWEDHQKSCGGTYTKVKDPPGFKEKQAKKLLREQQKKDKAKAAPSVKNFFSTAKGTDGEGDTAADGSKKPQPRKKPRMGKPNGSTNKKDEATWLDDLRNPTSAITGGATSVSPPRIADPSLIPFAVPENAMLVAGEDGDFYLVGDVGALFQFGANPPQQQLQERAGGLVDLTGTDDDEEKASTPLRGFSSQRTIPAARASDQVEIIEID